MKRVTRFARDSMALTAILLFVIYCLIAWAVPNPPLLEVLRALQITIGVVVMVAYWRPALEALKRGNPDKVEQLTLGIVLGFFALTLNGLWALLWRLSGQPMWMYQSGFNGFIVALSIIAGCLHVTAPGAVNGVVPKRNWIMVGCAVGAAIFVSIAILASRPNASWFIEALEPLLREDWGRCCEKTN